MVTKITLIGKGDLTDAQTKALKNYFGNFEIVEVIPTLQKLDQIPAETDIIVSLIMAVPVIQLLQRQNKPYYTFKVQQLGAFDEPHEELEKKADIKFTKETPNGTKKYIYSKTIALLKNPKIIIQAEEEIPF